MQIEYSTLSPVTLMSMVSIRTKSFGDKIITVPPNDSEGCVMENTDENPRRDIGSRGIDAFWEQDIVAFIFASIFIHCNLFIFSE